MSDRPRSENNGPTPTVKLGAPLVQVDHGAVTQPDPMQGMPVWAKIAGTLSAVGLVFALFTFLVLNMVRTQDRGAETLERLVDKFDRALEKHDARITDWMRAQASRDDSGHERTRAEIRTLIEQNQRMLSEQLRMHNEAMGVLTKILDRKN